MQNALNRKSVFPHIVTFFFIMSISVLAVTTPLKALGTLAHSLTTVTHSWSGVSIQMGDDPSFKPAGNANFEVVSGQLVITLTNTTAQLMDAPWQVLTGLTFGTNSGVLLTPVSAALGVGSLVGNVPSPVPTLNGEWALKALFGGFGISAVGSLNGSEVFGPPDLFDPSKQNTLPGSPSPNGVDYGIVGSNVALAGGFLSTSPYAKSQMVFTLNITGVSLASIHSIEPIFGSEGKLLIPEPSTIILLGFGFLVFGGITKFRRRN